MNISIEQEIKDFIENAFREDIRDGDHSSLAAIPADATDTARLLVKGDGILAGVELAKHIFHAYDPELEIEVFIEDGSAIKYGDVAFYVKGKSRSLLGAERLVLNCMQRMSGIATKANEFAQLVEGTNAKVLDTRKTTPGIRFLEKWAVRIGGGHNHRMGLYDMIMLKDNHVDFCGGIKEAILQTRKYLEENKLDLKVEIETRNLDEVKQVLAVGQVDRIMLDNFTPEAIVEALAVIDGKFETEASGGITLETVRSYAETGVDYISVGALTHSYKSLDLSLKAIKE